MIFGDLIFNKHYVLKMIGHSMIKHNLNMGDTKRKHNININDIKSVTIATRAPPLLVMQLE